MNRRPRSSAGYSRKCEIPLRLGNSSGRSQLCDRRKQGDASRDSPAANALHARRCHERLHGSAVSAEKLIVEEMAKERPVFDDKA